MGRQDSHIGNENGEPHRDIRPPRLPAPPDKSDITPEPVLPENRQVAALNAEDQPARPSEPGSAPSESSPAPPTPSDVAVPTSAIPSSGPGLPQSKTQTPRGYVGQPHPPAAALRPPAGIRPTFSHPGRAPVAPPPTVQPGAPQPVTPQPGASWPGDRGPSAPTPDPDQTTPLPRLRADGHPAPRPGQPGTGPVRDRDRQAPGGRPGSAGQAGTDGRAGSAGQPGTGAGARPGTSGGPGPGGQPAPGGRDRAASASEDGQETVSMPRVADEPGGRRREGPAGSGGPGTGAAGSHGRPHGGSGPEDDQQTVVMPRAGVGVGPGGHAPRPAAQDDQQTVVMPRADQRAAEGRSGTGPRAAGAAAVPPGPPAGATPGAATGATPGGATGTASVGTAAAGSAASPGAGAAPAGRAVPVRAAGSASVGTAGSASVGTAGSASPAAGGVAEAGPEAAARGSATVPGAPAAGRVTVGGGAGPGGPSGSSAVPTGGVQKGRGTAAADGAGGGASVAPAAPWRSRKVLAGAGAAVLVLVLVAVLVLVGRPGAVDEPVAAPSTAEQTPEPPPEPVLAAATGQAPMPSAAAVRAAIGPLVTGAGLGPGVHVSVLDVATGTELYGYQQADPATPASTTKLVTAAAALAARGAGYRIPTRVVAGAAPGEVVLVGGGDPTLAAGESAAYEDAARLDLLAEQVRTALGGATVSRVTVDSTLFTGALTGPGWYSDVVSAGYGAPITALMTDGARVNPKAGGGARRFPTPDLAAGQRFASLLGGGVTVARGQSPAPSVTPAPSGATSGAAAPGAAAPGAAAPGAAASGAAASGAAVTGPAPGTELGRVESPTMLRLVEVMLTESDNVVAEALARQVAIAGGAPASFEGGAAATRDLIAGYGLPVDALDLSDGSGLSRDNEISPALLTGLVRLAADGSHPELAAMFSGLPVGGWSGTLDTRFRDPAPPESRGGAGAVRAKTGSLDGVSALAGVLTTADGRLLAFALLADEVPARTVSKWQAEWRLDRIASALAACGCRA